jgi:hypothetical protein
MIDDAEENIYEELLNSSTTKYSKDKNLLEKKKKNHTHIHTTTHTYLPVPPPPISFAHGVYR